MALLRGSSSAETEIGIERCWALAQDVERAPEWQQGLERLEVIERDAEGRPLVCDTVNDAKFTKVRCRVRFTYDSPRRVSFTMASSEDLDAMEGSWELEPLAGGATRVTYSLAVDPGPIGRLARPLERLIRPLVVGRRAEEFVKELARRG
jgi:ribosome-associated toxin RatA of RatAB toxin-antitoxin module